MSMKKGTIPLYVLKCLTTDEHHARVEVEKCTPLVFLSKQVMIELKKWLVSALFE